MNNCMTGSSTRSTRISLTTRAPSGACKVKLRENCVVGIPTLPAFVLGGDHERGRAPGRTTQRTIADAWAATGSPRARAGSAPASRSSPGTDWRKADSPYVNQKFLGSQGGPAGPEYDGWVTYGNAVTNGLMFRDSVEIDEQKYPIRVGEVRIRPDSEGAGRRRGAPGARVTFGPKRDPMTAAYVTDGYHHPPRGTQGGGTAAPSIAFQACRGRRRGGARPDRAGRARAGRAARARADGGGGYGDPRGREPERVRDDVLARFVSFERAREVYGVVFRAEVLDDSLEVDPAETAPVERRRGDAVPERPSRRQGGRRDGRELGDRARLCRGDVGGRREGRARRAGRRSSRGVRRALRRVRMSSPST